MPTGSEQPLVTKSGTATPSWVPQATATLIPTPSNSIQASPVQLHNSTPATPVSFFPAISSNQDASSTPVSSASETLPQPANSPVALTSSPSSILLDPDSVIQKYPKLRTLSHAGRLAVRLAYESYFGKDLLHKSTVYGQKGHPPLPRDKVLQLKNKMLSIHLANVSSELEFEAVWTKCVNAINHSASSLRSKRPLAVINN